MTSQHKAQFVLLTATMIWGASAIVLDVVLDYLTPLHAMTMRFGIATLILSTFLIIFKKSNGFSLISSKTCIMIGWADAFGYLAATTGQAMTTAGLANLIATSSVFVVPFLVWKVEGTKPGLKLVLLTGSMLLGIFLISYNGNWTNLSRISILGIFVLLIAAFLFASVTVITGNRLDISNVETRKSDPLSFIYASLLHTFIPLIILSTITTKSIISLPIKIIPLLFILAIFPTLVAFSLYNWAIARLGSVQTSIYSLFQVIVPFFYDLFILDLSYSKWVYCGIIVIIISLLVIPKEQSGEASGNKGTSRLRYILSLMIPLRKKKAILS